jgi:hypothetical protein
MQKIIAVFNNRNQAMQFATAQKRLGIQNKVIDTPRELSSSCGISVVFEYQFIDHAKNIIKKFRMVGNVKFFLIHGDVFKKYQYIN